MAPDSSLLTIQQGVQQARHRADRPFFLRERLGQVDGSPVLAMRRPARCRTVSGASLSDDCHRCGGHLSGSELREIRAYA